MKKAIVIGATGMVGTQLIQSLIENEEYSEIVSLARRPGDVNSPKVTELVINFDMPETWTKYVSGDVLFSTLGTTLAQAKSKEAQYRVDFTYQYTVAKIAANNGISHYVLVSAAGANSSSKAFYMRMKGELEDAVQKLPFEYINILKPGILAGYRIKNRPVEKLGIQIMNGLNKIGLFNRYRPINARTVAKAMIMAVKQEKSLSFTLDEIFKLVE